MRPMHKTGPTMKRHALALAVALALHVAAAAAIHAGMQDTQLVHRTEVRKLGAELTALPPPRIEQPPKTPPPMPKQAAAAPIKVKSQAAPRPATPAAPASTHFEIRSTYRRVLA